MKRSEMIQKLDSEFIFPEGLASQILDVLEKAGMKPPLASQEFHDKWYQDMGYKNEDAYVNDNGTDESFFEWEKEDV